MVESRRISNSSKLSHMALLPASMKRIGWKTAEKSGNTVFPIITLWKLSVAMETRVLVRSCQNLSQHFPLPNYASGKIWLQSTRWSLRYWCLKVFTDEGRMHGRTVGRRLDCFSISSPLSFRLRWAKIKLQLTNDKTNHHVDLTNIYTLFISLQIYFLKAKFC